MVSAASLTGLLFILAGFAITVIVEYLVIKLFMRRTGMKVFLPVLCINLFTWPLAQLASARYSGPGSILLIEVAVFIVEIPLLSQLLKTGWKKTALMSFAANLASMMLGLILPFMLIFF